jgi:2-polyprenyl-3-methyl-5-hydroxy-6-metoxy-1,4-benzoquinol methylase/uncharacterized protein YbaR (Trm112 family)
LFPSTLELLKCPNHSGDHRLVVAHLLSQSDGETTEAILECPECGRWYGVHDGVADVVRDGLREWDRELEFLEQHRSKLPETFLKSCRPVRPGEQAPRPSPADQAILEEGLHWGRFMRQFWDVGDRSIFDLRVKGTHPPFYVAGVLEPDDRDTWKRWGVFPPAAGDACFLWLHQYAGRRGIDVGCGGGQFGLEAAQQGVNMIGCDPSFHELQLARSHARSLGLQNIDYVRAEPASMPFAEGSFDLLMAKDSLHHVPALDSVFGELMKLLVEGGHVLCHEHVAKGRLKGRLMQLLMPRAVQKIRSRYPCVEVPSDLLRDSANEDISAELVEPSLRRHCDPLQVVHSLFLAEDFELMAHFAFGKRRWISASAYHVGWWLERVLLLAGDRQHLTFHGVRRPSPTN